FLGLLIAAIPATDFSKYHLHPCYTTHISGFTKEFKSFLSILTRLLKMTLLAKKHCKFVESPTCLIRFILLAMQSQTMHKTAQCLSIMALLAQNSAKATLYLPLASLIIQQQSIVLGTLKDSLQFRGTPPTTEIP